MFTKMDKKILTISVITLVIILALVFLAYKYIDSIGTQIENTAGGASTETQIDQQSSNEQDAMISAPQIEIEADSVSGSNNGGLTICLDECGNGVCQAVDEECLDQDNNLNCVCAENFEDCPQDCVN